MRHCSISKRVIFWGLIVFLLLLAVSPAYAELRAEDCKPLDQITDYDDCWTCSIFLIFFDASNSLAAHVGAVLEGPAKQALAVLLGVWLAFQTAVFLGQTGSEPDLAEFVTKVGGMLFRACFAIVFLSAGSSFIFEYFVNPVITSAANLSTSLVTEATECSGEASLIPAPAGTLPMSAEVRSSLDCMTGGLGAGLRHAQKMALSLRCAAPYYYDLPFGLKLPNPIMWLWGCALGAMFWAISLVFPMTLMDAIFRIGLMVGMVPLFILAWVFPSTRHFAKTGWDIIFHSCLLFVVMALVMNMAVAMINNSISQISGNFLSLMNSGAYMDAYDDLADNVGFTSLFIVLAVCFFGILITPKAEEMTTQIAGGEFPPSCGMQALHYTLDMIITLVLLILTILTMGAGGIAILAKAMHGLCKTGEALKRLQKIMEKVKQNLRRMKQALEKTRQAVR